MSCGVAWSPGLLCLLTENQTAEHPCLVVSAHTLDVHSCFDWHVEEFWGHDCVLLHEFLFVAVRKSVQNQKCCVMCSPVLICSCDCLALSLD